MLNEFQTSLEIIKIYSNNKKNIFYESLEETLETSFFSVLWLPTNYKPKRKGVPCWFIKGLEKIIVSKDNINVFIQNIM